MIVIHNHAPDALLHNPQGAALSTHASLLEELAPPMGAVPGAYYGRPLDRGGVGCNAVSLHGGPGCYCMLHIRPEADDDLPRVTIVLCPLGENLVNACSIGRLRPNIYCILKSELL